MENGDGTCLGCGFPSPVQTLDPELINARNEAHADLQLMEQGWGCGTTKALPSAAWPCGELRDQILQGNLWPWLV